MRILVFGGRDYTDKEYVYSILNRCYDHNNKIEIISGMARGADKFAWQWAKDHGITCHEFPADWDRHKKAAGPIRNQQMLTEGKPEFAIAFPGGTGTADMFKRLTKAGVRILDKQYRIKTIPINTVTRPFLGISQPRREYDSRSD